MIRREHFADGDSPDALIEGLRSKIGVRLEEAEPDREIVDQIRASEQITVSPTEHHHARLFPSNLLHQDPVKRASRNGGRNRVPVKNLV